MDWPGCQTGSTKKKLSRVQRLACLRIIGAVPTTPTNVVEALPPLELVVESDQGQLRIVSGVWEVGPTYIPVEDIAVF
jgi:hypothetical protein